MAGVDGLSLILQHNERNTISLVLENKDLVFVEYVKMNRT